MGGIASAMVAALDLLAPPRCLRCAACATGPWRPWLCRRCAGSLVPVAPFNWRIDPHTSVPVHALWPYAGAARDLIRALKYQGRVALGRTLGTCLAAQLGRGRIDAVVPVPLHWRRRWRRGYNQAAVIARGIADALPGVHLLASARRARHTPPQTSLRGADRRGNVADAFRLRAGLPLPPGARVAIVDDVFTTGATVTALARPFARAGTRVSVVVVAVSPTTLRRRAEAMRRQAS